jgi:hypothetical protein
VTTSTTQAIAKSFLTPIILAALQLLELPADRRRPVDAHNFIDISSPRQSLSRRIFSLGDQDAIGDIDVYQLMDKMVNLREIGNQ